MSTATFRTLLIFLAAGFAAAFAVIVVPPLLESGDIISAFAAGFVNPYTSGYALDTILCAAVLAVWVIYEARTLGIQRGWIAVLLCIAPGVATGFAVYLLLRTRQFGLREQPIGGGLRR